MISKGSHQDLSNEGSNFILGSIQLGFQTAQTWALFDELQILADSSRAQKKHYLKLIEFSTRV